MSEHLPAGPMPRIIPIFEELSAPCPRAQHEQAREKLFGFYKSAATETRSWRKQAHEAGQRRQQAHNPLVWLYEAGNQLYAQAEQRLAHKRQQVIAGHLDNRAVNRHLGWPEATPAPTCPSDRQRPNSRQAVTAFAAIAALAITPTSQDFLPLTPDQKLELATGFAALCGSSSRPGPDRQSPPCHAPKLSLMRRNGEKSGEKGLEITLA